MTENRLDVKDFKILAELDRNARQSNSQIGKKVRLSKEVIKYRIDKLVQEGIIVRFYSVVNYFKLGIYKFKLYLRFSNADKNKIDEIADYFKKHKKTEWDATCTGRWDMIIGFLVGNVNEFDDEVQEVMNKFSKYIQEKAVTTTLYLVHHERGFLSNKTTNVVYHTSKDAKEDIDKTDKEIIRILTNNARMPVTEIAERIKATPRVVQYRIKELERRNIILAYKANLNPKAMGRIFCKALLYLANINQEKTNQFIRYLSSIPDAVWPQKVMGTWDFELDCEVNSYDRFQDIILDIKEKFPDVVRNHEFCIVSKENKLDFFPDAYPSL
ncbi:MAG: Lrp/AsnC family transcriptional regulator [Nanoarchaeota archaeon]